MLDTVRVAPQTFQRLIFMSSQAKKAFSRDNVPAQHKPQKLTPDGVPIWSVQVAAVDWRNNSQIFPVSVPQYDDPATKFTTGDQVQLVGLVYGVTPKREGGGFAVWLSADALDSAA